MIKNVRNHSILCKYLPSNYISFFEDCIFIIIIHIIVVIIYYNSTYNAMQYYVQD